MSKKYGNFWYENTLSAVISFQNTCHESQDDTEVFIYPPGTALETCLRDGEPSRLSVKIRRTA